MSGITDSGFLAGAKNNLSREFAPLCKQEFWLTPFRDRQRNGERGLVLLDKGTDGSVETDIPLVAIIASPSTCLASTLLPLRCRNNNVAPRLATAHAHPPPNRTESIPPQRVQTRLSACRNPRRTATLPSPTKVFGKSPMNGHR